MNQTNEYFKLFRPNGDTEIPTAFNFEHEENAHFVQPENLNVFNKGPLPYLQNQEKSPAEFYLNVNSFPFNIILSFIKNSPQLKSQIIWILTSFRSIIQHIDKHMELAKDYLTSSSYY